MIFFEISENPNDKKRIYSVNATAMHTAFIFNTPIQCHRITNSNYFHYAIIILIEIVWLNELSEVDIELLSIRGLSILPFLRILLQI